MAKVSNVLRTCGIFFCFIFKLCAAEDSNGEPWIDSFSVESKSCEDLNCKYLLYVRGGEFLGYYSWRLTPNEGPRGGRCDTIYPNYEIKEVETKQWFTTVEVIVPITNEKVFFCLLRPGQNDGPGGGKWVHQGEQLFLEPRRDLSTETAESKSPPQEDEQVATTVNDVNNDFEKTNGWTDLSHDIDINYLPNTPRPTRHERDDIEVLVEDKFIPLRDIEDRGEEGEGEKTTRGPSFEILYRENDQYVPMKLDYIQPTEKSEGPKFEIIYRDHSIIDMLAEPLYRKYADTYGDTDTNDILDKGEDETEFQGEFKKHKAIKREIISSPKADELKAFEVIDRNKEDLEFSDQKKDKNKDDMITRNQRQVFAPINEDFGVVRADAVPVVVEGIRIEDSDKEPKIIEESIPSVLADSKLVLRVFGQGLTPRTVIAFTHDPMEYGLPCKFLLKGEYMPKEDSVAANTALFEIWAPSPIAGSKLYICAKNLPMGVTHPDDDEGKYFHQGTETYKVLATHNKLLPLWVSLVLILVCLMFSALFSGLNLGLMSLDRTELKIISNTGTEQERKYARTIMPVRDHGNYLLCSILLGNVAVNSTFTILLDDLTSGLFAVIFSTLSIVLLGEITPQAICSRHGLMVGARSIMITKAVMALTAPLAFPVSKLLDYFLGEEIGNVYNRERLKELVKVTTGVNDLDKDEVNIISGALEMRKKTVADVMTKLEDVFMLPITSILDFETMSEIIKSGYSRIPVYESSRSNIITVLFIKDLAFVDPDDNTPLRTLCQYYQNPCNFVFEDVTLDVMFKQFKEGHKGHMAFVHRINNEGEGDPFYETIGLVTLEDVIEEMIQAEIVDETDVFMDNRTKRRRNRPQNKLQDFAAFAERHENQRIHISPQLTLATFQFLSTSVDAFRPDTVSETVLRRLLKQDVIQHIKVKGKTKKEPTTYVYQQGKAVDYFVLILEGRVEVTVGRENLVFEAGPFTYFGVQALTQNIGVAESPTPSAMGSLQNINMDAMLRHTFVPDYSVRAITELYYLTVKRALYLAAKRATLMEKGALSKGATNEQFDTEVDKLLQSVDEDISISGEHKTPSRQVSPNPVPSSASPLTRASFTSRASPEPHDRFTTKDEQEKLLK